MKKEVSEQNRLKYENYKEQYKRLARALKGGFNLEAMFIEYAILEDRTESILRHAGKWDAYIKSRGGRNATINSKVRYIQKIAEDSKSLAHRYFSGDLLEELLDWKEERNRLIHALLNQQFGENEIADLATQGNELVKKLKAKSQSFTRAIKQNEEAEK